MQLIQKNSQLLLIGQDKNARVVMVAKNGISPEVSSDGRFIAFTTLPPSNVDSVDNSPVKTWLTNVQSREKWCLGAGGLPKFSVSGKLIAFISESVSSHDPMAFRICVFDVESKKGKFFVDCRSDECFLGWDENALLIRNESEIFAHFENGRKVRLSPFGFLPEVITQRFMKTPKVGLIKELILIKERSLVFLRASNPKISSANYDESITSAYLFDQKTYTFRSVSEDIFCTHIRRTQKQLYFAGGTERGSGNSNVYSLDFKSGRISTILYNCSDAALYDS